MRRVSNLLGLLIPIMVGLEAIPARADSAPRWPDKPSLQSPASFDIDPSAVKPLTSPVRIQLKSGMRFRFRRTFVFGDDNPPIALSGDLWLNAITPKVLTVHESIATITVGGNTDMSGDYTLQRESEVGLSPDGRPWSMPAPRFVANLKIAMGEQMMGGEVFDYFFGDKPDLVDTAADCAEGTWILGLGELKNGTSVVPDAADPFLDRMADCALGMVRSGAAPSETIHAFIADLAKATSIEAYAALHARMRSLIEDRWPGLTISGKISVQGLVDYDGRKLIYAAGARQVGFKDDRGASPKLAVEMLINPQSGQIWRAIERGTDVGKLHALHLATPHRQSGDLRPAVEYITFEAE